MSKNFILISLRRDLPEGLVQTTGKMYVQKPLDLPGRTKSYNGSFVEGSLTTELTSEMVEEGKITRPVYGLPGYLLERVSKNQSTLTTIEANDLATSLVRRVWQCLSFTEEDLETFVGSEVAGASFRSSGSFCSVLDVLQILSGATYLLPEGAVIAETGSFLPEGGRGKVVGRFLKPHEKGFRYRHPVGLDTYHQVSLRAGSLAGIACGLRWRNPSEGRALNILGEFLDARRCPLLVAYDTEGRLVSRDPVPEASGEEDSGEPFVGKWVPAEGGPQTPLMYVSGDSASGMVGESWCEASSGIAVLWKQGSWNLPFIGVAVRGASTDLDIFYKGDSIGLANTGRVFVGPVINYDSMVVGGEVYVHAFSGGISATSTGGARSLGAKFVEIVEENPSNFYAWIEFD